MDERTVHKWLVEHGLEPFEGLTEDDIDGLVDQGKINEIQAQLIKLTCPEYVQKKRSILNG